MKLTKIITDEAVIKSLEVRGFFYVAKEQINGLDVFSFETTDELEKTLLKKYAEVKVVQENKLRFGTGG